MGKPVTIELTKKELDVILAMIAIASAGVPDEGDYQGFDYRALNRLRGKLARVAIYG